MNGALSLLWLPFAASIAFVLMHTWLGVHVLRRRVVFADLALAQLSALGATVAFAAGHAPGSAASFGYALGFTSLGALCLTALRRVGRYISHEAFIGILYVVATAVTIVVVDRAPQGAEHVKRMLVGSILTIGEGDVARIFALYGAIGMLHGLLRGPLLAVSSFNEAKPQGMRRVWLWDLVFFLSFGIVVTSSVSIAGVLLVFSFLIMPALTGLLFATRVTRIMVIGCVVGIVASAAGLMGAYVLDLPTGAAMVGSLAAFLLAAGVLRHLFFDGAGSALPRLRSAARGLLMATLAAILASSLWLIANPSGDQPLLTLFEVGTGLAPVRFMSDSDRRVFEDATHDSLRFQAEVDRLDAMEKTARYQGATLSDDEVRRIASYQQTFNEMTRGERFVADVLLKKARAVERWAVGLPAGLIAILGLVLIRKRGRVGRSDDRSPAARMGAPAQCTSHRL